MNKRMFAAMLAACIALLCGCQLALPEYQAPVQPDKLIGVVVTKEHLDLFDMEAYLRDHSSELLSGQIPGEYPSTYAEKLYAQSVEQNQDGVTTVRYEFPDLEGIGFYSFLAGNSREAYWSSVTTDGISDAHIRHDSRDDGVGLALDGTIYICAGAEETVFYYNPVYQDAEGQVYLIPGTGMSFGTGLASSASHTLSERMEYTEGGASRLFESDITITMESVCAANGVNVLEMDESNSLLRSIALDVSDLPAEYVPGDACAYLLVEEQTDDGIRRTLCQPQDRYLTVFRELDSGICAKHQIPLIWPD